MLKGIQPDSSLVEMPQRTGGLQLSMHKTATFFKKTENAIANLSTPLRIEREEGLLKIQEETLLKLNTVLARLFCSLEQEQKIYMGKMSEEKSTFEKMLTEDSLNQEERELLESGLSYISFITQEQIQKQREMEELSEEEISALELCAK